MKIWRTTNRISIHDHANDGDSFLRNTRIVALTGTVALIAFLLTLMVLRAPASHAVIELEASLVRQVVDRSLATQFKVPGTTRIDFVPECEVLSQVTSLLPVSVYPNPGAEITYQSRADVLSVNVFAGSDSNSGGWLEVENGRCFLGKRTRLLIDRSAAVEPLIFPLAGPTEAGTETVGGSQEVGHFYGGSINLYGRALLPPFRGALYPAGDAPIKLAEGGKVTAAVDLADGQSWYGVVRPSVNGLIVSATTDTSVITVIRPGAISEIEPFRIGLLAQLFNDPSVAPWTIGLFFVVSAIHLALALTAMLPPATQEAAKSAPTEQNNTAEEPPNSEPKQSQEPEHDVAKSSE